MLITCCVLLRLSMFLSENSCFYTQFVELQKAHWRTTSHRNWHGERGVKADRTLVKLSSQQGWRTATLPMQLVGCAGDYSSGGGSDQLAVESSTRLVCSLSVSLHPHAQGSQEHGDRWRQTTAITLHRTYCTTPLHVLE